MEKMLVAVFEDEVKAYEGARKLSQLDNEGSITVHAESVIKKNTDGTVSVLQPSAVSSARSEDPLA